MRPKIILNIDSPTRNQTKRAIDRYKKASRIYLNPSDYADNQNRCPGCGVQFSKLKEKQMYYGEYFCVDNCLSQWLKSK